MFKLFRKLSGSRVDERDDGAYSGDRNADGQRHGFGTATFCNGDEYAGWWHENVKHGIGRYTWASGETYEGRFVGGEICGHGIMTGPSHCYEYRGMFENGVEHGVGMRTVGTTSYEGTFVDGYAHGKGVETNAGTLVQFWGWYHRGQRVEGLYTDADGWVELRRYDGNGLHVYASMGASMIKIVEPCLDLTSYSCWRH